VVVRAPRRAAPRRRPEPRGSGRYLRRGPAGYWTALLAEVENWLSAPAELTAVATKK
jgi:hypothetical protein